MSQATKHVRKLLDRLGQTPDEVAESLRRRGVRGARFGDREQACPITAYLRQRLRFRPSIGVLPSTTTVNFGRPGQTTIRNPPPVHDFIRSFDDGRYPDLEVT